MLHHVLIAFTAAALAGTTPALAAGHNGGGGHGGGGMGHGGFGGGGFARGGGGGFGGGAARSFAAPASPGFAARSPQSFGARSAPNFGNRAFNRQTFARGNFRHGGRRFFGPALGLGLGYGAYSYNNNACYAWTPYGYQWVCGDYGYDY